MNRLLLTLFVLLLPATANAQLFRRFGQAKYSASSCPGGICPTSNRWSNNDGLSRRDHLEYAHGTDTSDMTESQIRSEQNHYHNTYGAGHPVKQQSAPRYQSYASVGYGSAGYSSAGYSSAGSRVIQSYGSAGSRSYGSAGSGPTRYTPVPQSYDSATPQLCPCPTASEPESSVSALGSSRRQFRKALLEAGRQAVDSGKISEEDYQVLRLASLMPRKLAEMQETVSAAAVEDGVASINAIDWDKLLAFLEKLIPFLLKLFASNDVLMSTEPYVFSPHYIEIV